MKKKKVCSWLIAGMVTIMTISACGKASESSGGNSSVSNISKPMGRYVESEIDFSKDKDQVLDMKLLDNGNIGVLLLGRSGVLSLLQSEDMGNSWGEKTEILPENQEEFIMSASLGTDGVALCNIMTAESESKLLKIDNNGNKMEVPLVLPELEELSMSSGVRRRISGSAVLDEDQISEEVQIPDETEISEKVQIIDEMQISEEVQIIDEMQISDRVQISNEIQNAQGMEENVNSIRVNIGNLIVNVYYLNNDMCILQDSNGQVYLIDIATGEFLNEYLSKDEYSQAIAVVNNSLYINIGEEIKCFDIESGKQKTVSRNLAEKISSEILVSGKIVLVNNIADNDLYYCDNAGLYRQAEEGEILEELFDSSLNSLNMPGMSVENMLVLDKTSYLVLMSNINSGEYVMYKYTYDANIASTPENEIKVYALEDNRELRQAINMYQKENTDTYVNLQIGVTGENGVNITDAISTLNTEIMAGNGPDILLLDKMQINSYIEKGLLIDISDVIEGINSKEELIELLPDNKYAVATRFEIPYIHGEESIITEIKDLESLKDILLNAKETAPDKDSFTNNGNEALFEYLYEVNNESIFNDNGEINSIALENLLKNIKDIKDIDALENEINVAHVKASVKINTDTPMNIIVNLLLNESSMEMNTVKSQSSLVGILGANESLDNYDYRPFTTSEGKVMLLPNTILGISSKSDNIENAKSFIEFMLSDESQKSNQGIGLPINKKSLSESLRAEYEKQDIFLAVLEKESGVVKNVNVEFVKPNEDEIKRLEEYVYSGVAMEFSNYVVKEIILEHAMNYAMGEEELNAAIDNIMQKISIYVME
jgi:ABC-type sugar transport system, periplasmic component